MEDYDEYIEMIRKSIWNLYLTDFIEFEEFEKLANKYYEFHSDYLEKKNRLKRS